MDGMAYVGSLVVIAIFIYTMMQHHNNMLAFIALVVGIYIVYSHETGYTATDFRHEMIDTIDENTYDYSKETDTKEVERELTH